MIGLIQTYGFGVIFIILLIAIPSIITCIGWCKSLWKKRADFIAANQEAGRKQLQEEEKEEHRFSDGERRIQKLEEIVVKLTQMQEEQQKAISRLERSDKLNIKTYIKEQHAIWTQKGCIDSQTLELLEERYEIYTEEGGNSWAKKLMDELRALPTLTIIPLQDIHENQ